MAPDSQIMPVGKVSGDYITVTATTTKTPTLRTEGDDEAQYQSKTAPSGFVWYQFPPPTWRCAKISQPSNGDQFLAPRHIASVLAAVAPLAPK